MTTFKYTDLLIGDILLFIPCPCLTRIVKQITPRSVLFHDGSSISATTLNRQLAKQMFEITRNDVVIFPE